MEMKEMNGGFWPVVIAVCALLIVGCNEQKRKEKEITEAMEQEQKD